MLNEQTLRQIVERVVAAAHPSRVILFGSYGRGDANDNSDVDLMVIKPKLTNPREEMLDLYRAIHSVGAGVDVLLYSEAEYQRRSQVPGTVLYWARKEGRAMYESSS
jgi:predicted nucleotidyltransferase